MDGGERLAKAQTRCWTIRVGEARVENVALRLLAVQSLSHARSGTVLTRQRMQCSVSLPNGQYHDHRILLWYLGETGHRGRGRESLAVDEHVHQG